MIPDEAVGAAHRAWREQAAQDGSIFEYNLRAALEAAAPHMLAPLQRPSRGWIAKSRDADGSVSIIGHFRDEPEAQKYADLWPSSFVEPA